MNWYDAENLEIWGSVIIVHELQASEGTRTARSRIVTDKPYGHVLTMHEVV